VVCYWMRFVVGGGGGGGVEEYICED